MSLPGEVDPILDVIGKLVIELREQPQIAALVGQRVRGFELAPGDGQGPGQYRRFVLLQLLDAPRIPGFRRAPVRVPHITCKVGGLTPQDAMATYGVVAAALHAAGPRVHANGLGIYNSFDDTGPSPVKDPETQQPVVDFVITLLATTQAVA
jgi:hypothetical protein